MKLRTPHCNRTATFVSAFGLALGLAASLPLRAQDSNPPQPQPSALAAAIETTGTAAATTGRQRGAAPRGEPSTQPSADERAAAAQSRAARTTARVAAANAAADETVQMDVFEVKGRTDADGYLQNETTTGTRIATVINDLPFQVNTITSEFMDDFMLLDPNGGDISNMASSLSDIDSEGNYQLRGFQGTYLLRDGFYTLGQIDRISIDRIDIIKGPSAAMYGQTTPAGIVNFITKRPKAKREVKVMFAAGSGDFYRGEISINTPLGSSYRVLNLLTAGASQTRNFTGGGNSNPYGYSKRKALFDSLVWKIGDMTQLTTTVSYTLTQGNDPMNSTMFTGTDIRVGSVDTLNKEATLFSQRGPAAPKAREQTQVTTMLEHRFNQVFSARVAGYFYYRSARQLTNTVGLNYHVDSQGNPWINRGSSSNSGNYLVNSDPAIAVGGEYTSRLTEQGGALQSDLTARYKLFGGRVSASSLIMIDFNDNRRRRLQMQMSQNRFAQIEQETNGLYTGNTVYLDDPDYQYFTPSWSDYTSINRNDDTNWVDLGFFLRQQFMFFNDRLRFYAGIRFDNMHFNMTYGDQFTQAGDGNTVFATYSTTQQANGFSGNKTKYTQIYNTHPNSPCVGVNYQYTRNVALYANYSQSFTPNVQSSQMGNKLLPNETGRGWDYGAKFNFLDQNLFFTLGGYYIIRDGVKVIGNLSNSVSDLVDYQAGGTQLAKGVEMDFNWTIGHGLTLLGNYGYVHTEVIKNPNDTSGGAHFVGRPSMGIPAETGMLALKYRFPAPLNGASATARVTYTGRAYPYSVSNSGGVTDATRSWSVPSVTILDVGLGYQFKYARLGHSLRVSARNITDKVYIDKNGNYQGLGRVLLFTYTITY